jgi:hypothetical protein
MSFRIQPLPLSFFQPLFAMPDKELARHGAIRQIVTSKPGFPCRISLEDAEVGEEILLVHFEHQSADTPYRASHAVYVRPGAKQANPEIDEVPQVFRTRSLSLRGFNTKDMMIHADLFPGRELEAGIKQFFADHRVAYIHIHNAKPGCYAARVNRA